MLRYPATIRFLAILPLLTAALPAAAASIPAQVTGPHKAPARTKGWSWKLPPDLVTPESNRRNNVFYVGEPVKFRIGGVAKSFEVRDYWGNLVDSGPSSTATVVKVTQPGWYKLYVYGWESRPEWGDILGGTNFVIFRNNPHF